MLAAIFAALAVAAAVQAARPAPAATQPVVTAAGDLRADVLGPDDVAIVEAEPGLVPEGALDPADPPYGRTLAGPVRAGEPLTDVRLVQSELLAGFGPGMVLATVRVADPAAATLLEPGDRVDVVGSDPRGGGAAVVASDVGVVIPPSADDTVALGDGAPIVLAMDQSAALVLADASVSQQLTVLLRE
jgi:Flp pilus assembly protein CpaB